MEEIIIRPIGMIHTPFSDISEIPIETRFAADYEGRVVIYDGFSHVYLLYHFHQTERIDIIGVPFLENIPNGII